MPQVTTSPLQDFQLFSGSETVPVRSAALCSVLGYYPDGHGAYFYSRTRSWIEVDADVPDLTRFETFQFQSREYTGACWFDGSVLQLTELKPAPNPRHAAATAL